MSGQDKYSHLSKGHFAQFFAAVTKSDNIPCNGFDVFNNVAVCLSVIRISVFAVQSVPESVDKSHCNFVDRSLELCQDTAEQIVQDFTIGSQILIDQADNSGFEVIGIKKVTDNSFKQLSVYLIIDILVESIDGHSVVMHDVGVKIGVNLKRRGKFFFGGIVRVCLCLVIARSIPNRGGVENIRRGCFFQIVQRPHTAFSVFCQLTFIDVTVITLDCQITHGRIITDGRACLEIIKDVSFGVDVVCNIRGVHMSRERIMDAHIKQTLDCVFPVVKCEVFQYFVFLVKVRKCVLVENGHVSIVFNARFCNDVFHKVKAVFGYSAACKMI